MAEEAKAAACGPVDGNYDFTSDVVNQSDVQKAHRKLTIHRRPCASMQHCRYAWIGGRKPKLCFETPWYLAANPHVARL